MPLDGLRVLAQRNIAVGIFEDAFYVRRPGDIEVREPSGSVSRPSSITILYPRLPWPHSGGRLAVEEGWRERGSTPSLAGWISSLPTSPNE
jgi:hypothetical protein